MEEIELGFPDGMTYDVSLDSTLPITAGLRDIVVTLIIALVLVILVVFIFIQDWRATLIPTLAIPVSLIGAFIFFPALGFTINVLSLLGLVLAIGIVVDDAIVVVEAVQVNIAKGMTAKEATIDAMKKVSGPILATTLVLVAVFIPVAGMAGITGILYKQFAITIVVSVLVSSVNALTLSPALCALLLKKPEPYKGVLGKFFAGFNGMDWPNYRQLYVLYPGDYREIEKGGNLYTHPDRGRGGFWGFGARRVYSRRGYGIFLCQYPIAQCGFPPAIR